MPFLRSVNMYLRIWAYTIPCWFQRQSCSGPLICPPPFLDFKALPVPESQTETTVSPAARAAGTGTCSLIGTTGRCGGLSILGRGDGSEVWVWGGPGLGQLLHAQLGHRGLSNSTAACPSVKTMTPLCLGASLPRCLPRYRPGKAGEVRWLSV